MANETQVIGGVTPNNATGNATVSNPQIRVQPTAPQPTQRTQQPITQTRAQTTPQPAAQPKPQPKARSISDFLDRVEQEADRDKEQSIRKQIIDEYPRLRRIMEEKGLSRHQMYAYFTKLTDIELTEKTFLNYLASGKLAMDKAAKKARKDAKKQEEGN